MESVVYRPLGSGEAVVVDVGNELRGGSSEEFRHVVRHLVSQGVKWMILDFGKALSVDSMAVGVLIMAFRLCEESGGEVILLQPQRSLISLLEMLTIDQFFRVFADEGEALDALKAEGVDVAEGK